MKLWKINRSQRKTALKMARTILDRLPLSNQESSGLLMDCLQLALRDLLDRNFLEWSRPLPKDRTVVWTGGSARQAPCRQGLRCLEKYPEDETVDRAFEGCESIFDQYHLDEDERDALFTALPCLTLLSLEDFLTWKKKPPFPEVG